MAVVDDRKRERGHTREEVSGPWLGACVRTFIWTCLWVCLSMAPTGAQEGTANGEWRSYAGDVWGTKYSPLNQITPDNFDQLEVAWRWRTADSHLPYESEQGLSLAPAAAVFARLDEADPNRWVTRPSIGRLSATPLMVAGVLYLATPLYQAAAIDARTGETLWVLSLIHI